MTPPSNFAERGGLIKIGYSTMPESRVKKLRARFLNAIEGTRKDEAALHAKFSRLRVEGEWFLPSWDLLEFIFSQPRWPGWRGIADQRRAQQGSAA